MKYNKGILKYFAFIIPGLLFFACSEDYVPKPQGYFRIDLPEKKYQLLEADSLPFSFEYPVYSIISRDELIPEGDHWFNITFPDFKGKIHLSYVPVKGNLAACVEDSRNLVNKHIPKANAIEEQLIINDDKKVYGTYFEIKGINAASTCQFYLTDSTSHFLRGALYFEVIPNNDSLAPVIDFVQKDIKHIIETIAWHSSKK